MTADRASRAVVSLADVPFSMRLRLHLIAGVAVAFLSVYGRAVCPFVAGVQLPRLVAGLLAVAAAQIALREALYRLVPRPFGRASLARHGMVVSIFSWLVAGVVALALHMALYPDFPMGSHIKLLTGYWALGGGILSQLDFVLLERYLRKHGAVHTVAAQSVERITRRLMESYVIFTIVPALILVLVLLRNVYEGHAGMGQAVEGMFVGAVFVGSALVVSRQYGLALREDCDAMRKAVLDVAEGRFDVDLDSSRPDEIGLVARSICAMGQDLAVREKREVKLLQITSAFSEQLHLDRLLRVITTGATQLVNAERSTLYLYDARRDQLWTPVAEGMNGEPLYLDKNAGLAGATFTTQEAIILDDVRADPRFNAATDRATGFTTKSMLCVPVNSKDGKHLGVIQVLNRRDGAFGPRDESRLRAMASQSATAIENAQLFEDVLNLKNYAESILRSLSNGVISLDRDLNVTTLNEAAERILGCTESDVAEQPASALFHTENEWVMDSARTVMSSGVADHTLDVELVIDADRKASVNLTAVPLIDASDEPIGQLLIMEDLSAEKRTRATMSRYMPKEVVEQVLSGHRDVIEGRMQQMTLLFTDIRSFTTISEAIGPRATVAMLNEYFEGMVDVVHDHGGILDKYIGDAIMALFGVPLGGEHDERDAVAAANDMMRALAAINARREAAGLEPIMHGIGVSTGEAVAGNIGSPRRMDYTVIGDSVNLTARIESITKFYKAPVLVSEMTVKLLDAPEYLREVDCIRVKGKSDPVTIFESFEYRADRLTDELLQAYEIETTALAAYRTQNWADAERLFQQAQVLAPADRIPEIYLERIAHYQSAPPGPDWDGVWTMLSK